jgi:hypothetical protein
MATGLDRKIDELMTRFGNQHETAVARLEIHYERADQMPWHERLSTYFERRYERQQAVYEVTESLKVALHHPHTGIEPPVREVELKREPSRDRAERQRERINRSRDDDMDLGR